MWSKMTPPIAGQACFIANFKFHTKVRFLVQGPGIVRFGTNKNQLETPNVPGVDMGLPQTNAQGEIEREWTGELWAVSSVPSTPVMIIAPEYEYYSQKGLPPPR